MEGFENLDNEIKPLTIREKLESEIAPVQWVDLQIPFARGIVLFVDPQLELIDVAESIANDDTTKVKTWMQEAKISHITNEQAQNWYDNNSFLLTAIVKPWVLIQPVDS